ncbi:MAG: prolyl oligopeptidase family serine peptidase, partial [Phycisphaerales bacterium]
EKPLKIEGRLPEGGVLARGAEPIPADIAEVAMLRDRLGVVKSLDARAISSINRLSRTSDDPHEFDDPGLYLHISRGTDRGVLEVHPGEQTVLLRDPEAPETVWTVRREAFDRLGIPLSHDPADAQAPFEASTSPVELTLPAPHAQSEIVLDRRTVRSRIRSNFPTLSRTLGEETCHVRLPRDFDPRRASGVLVWISPTPSGRIPDVLGPACDELGLIAVGVDRNGNKREITDRLQNHLDSIETLAQRARIDRERIYLTGMSGGGRCSGILLLAFPDVFAGAVPIVGLDTYHNAPTGRRGQYWPSTVGKPAGKWMRLLRTRRIRSITGSADFNEPEMVVRTGLLQEDGCDAEIDVIEGMAHTMPNASQFERALDWVDEPRRESMNEAEQAADTLLSELEDRDPTEIAVRRQLIEIMNTVPFTEQAWEAASRLGYPRE